MDDPFEELKEKMVLTEEQAAAIKDPS